MKKLKELFLRYKEIIMYLIFGVLTTLIGFVVYFVITKLGTGAFHKPDGTPADWLVIAANIIQWVCAVLFAFFTNRKYVFENSEKAPMLRQLLSFASARVATLVIDTVLIFALQWLLLKLSYQAIFGLNANDLAKCISAVVVIILNYVFSKIFVFKNKKPTESNP